MHKGSEAAPVGGDDWQAHGHGLTYGKGHGSGLSGFLSSELRMACARSVTCLTYGKGQNKALKRDNNKVESKTCAGRYARYACLSHLKLRPPPSLPMCRHHQSVHRLVQARVPKGRERQAG